MRLALLAALAVLLLGAAAIAAVIATTGSTETREEEGELAVEPEFPTALARHIEDLKQALPGRGGESEEGPGTAAEYAFLQRAYPDSDIPLARIEASRSAFASAKSKGFPRGRGQQGTWVTIGPSNAIYPFFDFRNINVYVPNEYAAGGRTTSIAIGPTCNNGHCPLYISPAGGGVWRTKNALNGQPNWQYLSGSFEINAIGTITIDPNDPNTIWVGTGEPNACGSGCVAGVGIYKSTDGGDTWTGPLGKSVFNARGVGSIAIKPGSPDTIYAASGRALRGHSSVCCGGAVSIVPGAAKWGLYKSTDGGANWSFIHNGAATTAPCTGDATEAGNGTPCSPRGVRRVVLDPSNPEIVYAASYARGVWRSNDGGATWTQIKPSLNSAVTTTRPEIAVTTSNGKTRMYVYEGHQCSNPAAASQCPALQWSRLFRSDDVATGAPVFTDLTSNNPANPGYGTFNNCTGQCWYDNYVYTPKGHPDVVYVGGSNQYGESGNISNARGVVLSTDAGVSFTDMTMDATDAVHPNGIHPDHHGIVANPNNPFQFFEAGDGGVVRSSGAFASRSGDCDGRGLSTVARDRCKQLLSRIPTEIESMNKGLSTLQFQSLSISPFNSKIVQGGTQDNGTWESDGNPVKWLNTMIGDGGQSGFDASMSNFRFHTFFDASPDVNFSNGATIDWNWIADPIFGTGAQFYAPIISDPVVSRTMFAGTLRVMRTKTHGMGSMTLAELRQHCNEWTGDFAVQCGDWVQLGPTTLTSATLGDRSGGNVAATERATSDTSTMWAATTTGRVFVSKNVDAEPASSVLFDRIDDSAANDPNRFVSSIYVDPANANHAWISYSGFNASTPATPGHVFEVTYNPVAGTATWVSKDGDLGDLPITDLVRDDPTGDLYAASDFGSLRLASGTTTWTLAAPGMPNVEIAGLTIVPGDRKLFAATHGLSAWQLNLP